MVLPNSRMVEPMMLPNRAWWLSSRYVSQPHSSQTMGDGFQGFHLAQEGFCGVGLLASWTPGPHSKGINASIPHLNFCLPNSDQIDEFADSHLLPSPAARSGETTRLPLACSALLFPPLTANGFQNNLLMVPSAIFGHWGR
jgi:hypothetical protein